MSFLSMYRISYVQTFRWLHAIPENALTLRMKSSLSSFFVSGENLFWIFWRYPVLRLAKISWFHRQCNLSNCVIVDKVSQFYSFYFASAQFLYRWFAVLCHMSDTVNRLFFNIFNCNLQIILHLIHDNFN